MEFPVKSRENLQDPFSKIISLLLRLYPGIFRHCQRTFLFLEKYPDPSVCVFVGLITGMLPSLFREAGEQGRSKGSYVSMILCMCAIFALLMGLHITSIEVAPNFFWYLFCGFCPGPEPDRSGNEFFHPAHAVRPVYAFCRRDRPF